MLWIEPDQFLRCQYQRLISSSTCCNTIHTIRRKAFSLFVLPSKTGWQMSIIQYADAFHFLQDGSNVIPPQSSMHSASQSLLQNELAPCWKYLTEGQPTHDNLFLERMYQACQGKELCILQGDQLLGSPQETAYVTKFVNEPKSNLHSIWQYIHYWRVLMTEADGYGVMLVMMDGAYMIIMHALGFKDRALNNNFRQNGEYRLLMTP